MRGNVVGLQCTLCGGMEEATPETYTCLRCGEQGILDVLFDYDYVRSRLTRETLAADRDLSMWRYLPLLPCEPSTPRPALRVGWTPLYRADRYARAVGLREVYVKDDGLNPTCSLKDRASALGVVKAMEAGASAVACSSTGNAGSSLAGNAASAGIPSYIFVPERAPKGKLAQLLLFGATVVSVRGNYEDAFRLSMEAIRRWGWYNRNAALNPYLVEGKKTVSLEIAEQMGWRVPDWVVVSVGDGCTIAGVGKGFGDLAACGLIDRVPRLLGAQAEGCAPIYRAYRAGREEIVPEPEETMADSIAVGVPRNPVKALRAVKKSGGEMITVSDGEILEAMRLLGSTGGLFAEPAAAAGFAGLARAVREGIVGRNEVVVGIITGNGLKDVAGAMRAAGEPIHIPPDVGALAKAMHRDHG
ncbi:MAG: threonine synthase [Bacillota bacterium]|nr:threonine synthase [Bacillota bacterium]